MTNFSTPQRRPPSEEEELRQELGELTARLAKVQELLASLGGGPAPAAPAPLTGLDAQLVAQAEKVRDLKKAKAPKEQVQAEVEKLMGLKVEAVKVLGEKVRDMIAAKAPEDKIQEEVEKLADKAKGAKVALEGLFSAADFKQVSGMLQSKGAAGSGAAAPAAAAAKAKPKAPRDWRFDLLNSVGEECQEEEDMAELIQRKDKEKVRMRCYDGFEPSGRMHIAQGVFKTINVNKCTKAGCTFVFWVADWFALMNDKMGGSLERIKTVGQYLVEVWRAAGMNLENVEFVWSSDAINSKADEYWGQMLDIARNFTLARIIKCGQIMGRGEDAGKLTSAQILYPLMQCTDIFFLRADICQLGKDQRKVNMLAREYCDAIKLKNKPVILSHHMMAGLKEGQEKMSKSDPDSAIFMEDLAADVERKIGNAWCPKDDLEKSPVFDYLRNVVFSHTDKFTAGGKVFTTSAEVEKAFVSGDLSEADLKKGLTDAINAWVQPVRDHFEKDARAKEIFEKVRRYKAEVDKEKAEAELAQKEKPAEAPAVTTTPEDRDFIEKTIGWSKDILCVDSRPKETAPQGTKGGSQPTALVPVLPAVHPRLGDALTLALTIRNMQKQGAKVTLLLLDWAGYVLNVANGDRAAIKKLLEYTAAAALAALPDIDKEAVQVKFQSEAALADPDTYWVGVINAGRAHKLSQIRGALGSPDDVAEGERVGPVIASLMFIEDCIFHGCNVIAAPQRLLGVARLAADYATAKQKGSPLVFALPSAVPCLREGFAGDAVADLRGLSPDPASHGSTKTKPVGQLLLISDDDAAVDAKIKRAYCPPEEDRQKKPDNGNPVADIAHVLMVATGATLKVLRDEKYGGNKEFSAISSVHEDMMSGKLHPGDLKKAVVDLLKAFMAALNERSSPEQKKLVSAVQEIGERFPPPGPATQQSQKQKGGKQKK